MGKTRTRAINDSYILLSLLPVSVIRSLQCLLIAFAFISGLFQAISSIVSEIDFSTANNGCREKGGEKRERERPSSTDQISRFRPFGFRSRSRYRFSRVIFIVRRYE